MGNFLENPLEDKIASFQNAIGSVIHDTKSSSIRNNKVMKRKKQQPTGFKADKDNQPSENTVKVRISVSVEQIVKEKLLDYYKKTGRKMSFREFSDLALSAYIENFSF